MKAFTLAGFVVVMSACSLGDKDCDSGASCDSGSPPDADADSDTDADTDADVDLIDDALLSFSVVVHPCAGNRTDALWVDDGGAYVGCGTTTTGTGLFTSSSSGTEWAEVSGFEDFRVNNLWRAEGGGPLYVSGNSTVGDGRVLSIGDTTESVWDNGSTSEMSFSVGAFARGSDGVAVAESLTGNGVVVQSSGTDWLSGYGWWGTAGHSAVQILDLDTADGAVVGVGNVISQPPTVYLPPREWDFGAVMGADGRADGLWEIVELSDDFGGELWDIDGDAHGLAVGGVNQDDGHGVVWTIGSDWSSTAYSPSAWQYTDVRDVLGAASPTWVRGVCRRGDRVAAVGEYSSLGDGFVLISQDGGDTFADRSGEVSDAMPMGMGLGPIHRCQFSSDGRLYAGGSDGVFVRHLPSE